MGIKEWFENTFDPEKNGIAQSVRNSNAKIANGAKVFGKNLEKGFNYAKDEAGKLYSKIKSVPVLGDIVNFVEQSPIGTVIKSGIEGVDSAIHAGTDLLQGNFKSAGMNALNAGLNLL
jgi:hypothetical protein